MKLITNKKLLYLACFLIAGCDMVDQFFNPFQGKWKAAIVTLEFEKNKTFVLTTNMGFKIQSEGTYSYDENKLSLEFSDESKTEFEYEFNTDKNELSITPQTKSNLFKTVITFKKVIEE